MNNIVSFNNHELKLIEHDNQKWFSSVDIANALNFSKPNAVTKIYNNHKTEFDSAMSCLPKAGKQRIFNREGAWLIGMFARTPKAAEFRKWVLKVLGTVADNQLPTAQVDMRAIGGMVKKCCAVAVREELSALLAGDPKADWELDDKGLIYDLYRWHNTKNKADTEEFRRLHAENDRLLAENRLLKEKADQIKALASF